MKKVRTAIGIVISAILIIVLTHPEWLPLSGKATASLKDLELGHFLIERSFPLTLTHILTVVLAICVVWLVYTVLRLILSLFGRKDEHAATVVNLIRGILKYLAVIVAVVWSLSILGVNTTAVLAGVGIIGLILGFGAQSLIEDIITGIFIIFEGQYSDGDIIILDDFRGVVREVGVRTTVIEDAGGNLKVVNNSDIRNFQNRSRKNSLALVDVSVAYSTDLKRLEKVVSTGLPKMFAENQNLYLTTPRYMGVEKLGDSGIELRFCADVKEENIFVARRKLARDIKIMFDENDIEIPFPQVVVHQGD